MSDAIAVGDFVKQTSGDVTGVVKWRKGESIRIATGYNTTVIGNVADWEPTSQGISAGFSGPGVRTAEVAQNALAFSVLNKVFGGGFYNPDVRNFIIADVAAEIYLGDAMLNWGVSLFDPAKMSVLAGDDATGWMPSQLSLKMSANKLITLTVVDTALRWYFKMPQMKGRVANILKTYGALVAGNSIEKAMRKETSNKTFAPR